MKNRIIILMIVMIMFSFGLIGIGLKMYFFDTTNDKSKNEKNSNEKIQDKFSNEKMEMNDRNIINLLNQLNQFADTIYQSKGYEKYPKKDKMYFISLKQLNEDFDFDISNFVDEKGNTCDIEQSGVYFDTDDILKIDFRSAYYPIVPTLIGCGVN